MKKLIGLGGQLRSGKDTAADYLVAEHGYVKFGMSDALNDFLVAQNPIVHFRLETGMEGLRFTARVLPVRYAEWLAEHGYVAAKEKLEEFRAIMQRTGTEAGRQVLYENVWVDAIMRKIQASEKPVVVTGIRFDNEVEMIESLGGETVWVHRSAVSPSKPSTELDEAIARHPAGKGRREAHSALQHASETSVSAADFRWTIVNDSTLEELYRQIAAIATLDEVAAAQEIDPYSYGGTYRHPLDMD